MCQYKIKISKIHKKDLQCSTGKSTQYSIMTYLYGKIRWRREWQPTPVFLPGESHGQRSPGKLQPTGSQGVGHD